MDLNSIPRELKTINNWVLWKLEDRKNKNGEVRKTKTPYQINKKMALSNTSNTWSSYEKVTEIYKKNRYSGIGFMFTGSGITGIDIDHCIENGKMSNEAQNIINSIDSYTEKSQSGTGIHIYAKGTIPKGFNQEIEMYCSGRYFAVTGDKINDKKIEPRQDQLNCLYEKYQKVDSKIKKAPKIKKQAQYQFPKPKGIELITKFISNIWKEFESVTGIEKRFVKFAMSMQESKAWNELTIGQIGLYHELKSKYTKTNGKFNEDNISFPKSEWIKYYSRKSAFDKDMDKLIELGFIKVILYRGKKKLSTIYGYSNQWKHYGTNEFRVTNKDRRPKNTLTVEHKKAISIVTKKNLEKRYAQMDRTLT